jgi:AcrR family transcriptional regulator
MPAATDTRTSPWGSPIPTTILQDFIRTAIGHDALADFVGHYVVEAIDADGHPPADLGDALRVAVTDVIEAATSSDWNQVGDALVAGCQECIEEPPPTARSGVSRGPGPYRPDGPKARARRETANRLIDAYEYFRQRNADAPITLPLLVEHAGVAKETLFAQFGRTAGLRWAADARLALALPMLWAEVGLADTTRTPLEQAWATGREYLRLALTHRSAMRALVQPHELDELLRPKKLSRYRTLQEFKAALARRVGEQDRLLEQAINRAALSRRDDAVNGREVAQALNAAWLRLAAQAWQLGSDDEDELYRELAARTEAILGAPAHATSSPA